MMLASRPRTILFLAALSPFLLAACSSGPGGDSQAGGGGGSSGGDGGAGPSTGGAGGTGPSTGGAGGTVATGGGGAGGGSVQPLLPFGGSSDGSGGPAPADGALQDAGGIQFRLVVPSSPQKPSPLLLVYSGTEGGAQMTSNLQQVAQVTGTGGFIFAVLDGVDYYGDDGAGATVLDWVRASYDIDNDRTYLLGESAGTTAALKLGFFLRQDYFAAYWANDVNASDTPSKTAAQLGFAPWGQVGPGGQQATAQAIVDAMEAAGYKLPNPAPYAGPGADTHGSPDQFIAAVSWFPGKSRD